MGRVVIKCEPATISIGPYGFYYYAKEFLQTRNFLQLSEEYSPVPYFLTCRSIELSLKAFLLSKDVRVKYLRDKIGHNLDKAYCRAITKGLDSNFLSEAEITELEKANEYYMKKGFEYFKVSKAASGRSDLPDLHILDRIANKLIKTLRDLEK